MDDTWVVILVALLGSTGIAGVITSIVSSVATARKGVSAREDDRTQDIVRQRDDAWQRMEAAEEGERAADDRADRERARRIGWQEQAVRLRLQLIMAGIEPEGQPPIDEDTEPPRKD